MTSGPSPLEYRRLRAPREDRSTLIEPPLNEAGAVAAANAAARAAAACEIAGLPWAEFARQAREELLAEVIRYTSSYRDVPGGITSGGMPSRSVGMSFNAHGGASDAMPPPRVFVAGHQPQLFHPGVWLKNFALGALAREHGAIAVNLVIDSDTMKTHAPGVPGGAVAEPHVAPVPLDDPGPAVPFEERSVLNREVFASFGARAAERIAPLVPEPIVRRWWPSVFARSAEVGNLGASLAQARHQLEGQFGLATLEVPQSRVCRTRSFCRFTTFLLAELPWLARVYNDAVREYRRLHRIRSTAHPFPDLAVDGPWHEAPFWVWTGDDPRRRRLFVRRDPDRLLLSDREQVEVALPFSRDGDLDAAAERLVELGAGHVRIRSRALVTTLFARLLLGDLFVHGIGGAKYDQVTDAVIVRFFGLPAPGYLVVSATLLLPVARPRATGDALRAIDSRLRELTWHPEKALQRGEAPAPPLSPLPLGEGQGEGCFPLGEGQGEGPDPAHLVAAKRKWIETPPTPQNARTRWLEIRRINRGLQPWVSRQRDRLLSEQERLRRALAAEKVLAWREYPFCLFPEPTLREFLAGMLEAETRLTSRPTAQGPSRTA